MKGICDMCGKEGDLVDAIVEGAVMNVCLNCANHGSVITINQPVVDKKRTMVKEDEGGESIDVVADDFAEKIKKARERKEITQEDLAKFIAEKESVIHQLESGKLKPNFKLAHKLEVFLNISLVDKVETKLKKDKKVDFKDGNLTIGDIITKD
jgi:putative transcription factor